MQDINSVTVTGHLVKDMDITMSSAGLAIGKFTIVCNASQKKEGGWVDIPSYFDTTMFGARATALKPYMLKGQQVVIQGRLKQDRWEKDGQKHYKVGIVCDNLVLSSKGGGKPTSNKGGYTHSAGNIDGEYDVEDKVPF